MLIHDSIRVHIPFYIANAFSSGMLCLDNSEKRVTILCLHMQSTQSLSTEMLDPCSQSFLPTQQVLSSSDQRAQLSEAYRSPWARLSSKACGNKELEMLQYHSNKAQLR